MLRDRLTYFKKQYIDVVDPEGEVVKSALRTALTCGLTILLLQFYGNTPLSVWGGFATFSFIQNDPQGLFLVRLRFLSGVIIVFTALTCFGMLLGNYLPAYLLSVPVILFACAYIACLGFSYFNAGGWAAFLYILAGFNPNTFQQTMVIGVTFLICGCISLLACFLIFRMRPYQKLMISYERVLILLPTLLSGNRHYRTRLDQALFLHEKNLNLYLKTAKTTTTTQIILINLSKLLYQINLIAKSTFNIRQQFHDDGHYASTHLENCHLLVEKWIMVLIEQVRYKKQVDFSKAMPELDNYRENLTTLRKCELMKARPDFSNFLEYSSYFYHFIKLLELLQAFSENINKLSEIK